MAFAADNMDQERGGTALFSGRGLLVGLLIAALFTAATLFIPLPSLGSLSWLGSLDPLTPWIAPGAAVLGFVIGLVGHKLAARAPAVPEEEAFVAAEPEPEAVLPEEPAVPLVTPSLADLGIVQLVERLALALQRWPARDLAIPASLRDDLAALIPSEGRG